MSELRLYIAIDCPDYGKLKIKNAIPFDLLDEYQDSKSDLNKAFKKILKSIIKEDAFDISQLTKNDLDYIAKEIAKLHKVETKYLNLRKKGIQISESLLYALKDSPNTRRIEEVKVLTKPLSERLKMSNMGIEGLFENISRMEQVTKKTMSFQSRFEKMTKEVGGISSIARALDEISEAKKSFGKEILKTYEKLPFGNVFNEVIKKNSIELQKISNNIISELSVSGLLNQAYMSRINGLFQNIESISNALQPVSGLLSKIEEANKSFLNIGEKVSTLLEPLELTNSALIESSKIVSLANKYFSEVE
ncbi:MAG: hypothetical protein ACOC6D_08440, partial [Atribacterota bacterium]